MQINRIKGVEGELRVPSDKSISHRAVIFGAIATGDTEVYNWLDSADTRATLRAIESLGVKVIKEKDKLILKGRSYNFTEPKDVLDAANSGTTARLMSGVLATQEFFSVVTGDDSLRNRPMLRVVEPLRNMGALLDGREKGNKLPICIRGNKLKGISYFNKKSSAQVKSSLLLAGLKAEGITEVIEPTLSRDHTERMLKLFGAEVITLSEERGHIVKLKGMQELEAREVFCPADISSAAFFVALTLMVEKGELLLRDVLINPTRDGFLKKVMEMGADIQLLNTREVSMEPVADIFVKSGAKLKAVEVKPEEIPSLIDEIPILAVLMATAEGTSIVRGAKELRVKESDRIRAVVQNLRNMGIDVEEFDDGFAVKGGKELKGTEIRTYSDHRIAMAFTVAGLVAHGETTLDDVRCVQISYPNFYVDLTAVSL